MKIRDFLKKNIIFFMITAIIICNISGNCMYADDNINNMENAYSEIPKEATEYVQDNFKNILEAAKKSKTELANVDVDWDSLSVGKPFAIIDMSVSAQDEIYYYPIKDEKKIFFTIAVANTTMGWKMMLSRENVQVLNEVEYLGNGALFYKNKEEYLVFNEKKAIGVDNSEILDEFENLKTSEMIKITNDKINKMRKVDIEKIRKGKGNNSKLKSQGGFLLYSNGNVILDIYEGAVGQGNYNLCWAASMATILNYINGKSYSAKSIADNCQVKYDTGATISQVKDFFGKYSVSYKLAESTLSISKIRQNLKYKKPVFLSTVSLGGAGHAVTLYGITHTEEENRFYMSIWNPGIENGIGGTQLVPYNDNDSVSIFYGNEYYVWNETLSYK